MGKIVKRALAVAAVAAGVSVAGPVSQASATQDFVTPRYQMTCSTGTTGSTGAYWGYATCYSPYVSKWKVRVSCSFGLNPESVFIYTDSSDGWKTLYPTSSCYWGVNYVEVVEGV
ncbi:hypothetical protein [Amycolatopsis sp. NPDC059657]|uniref:hypothetical protein n=1 Tax=Amycolatopsis sp. NPDC059657 TaxID=3346899 RepID=UPI00366BD80C